MNINTQILIGSLLCQKKSKEKLTELLELGVRRNNDLNKALKKAGLPQLKFTQLNNFKSRFTASTIGKPSATLGELETQCTNNKSIPDDMDKVFCDEFIYELKKVCLDYEYL